MNTKKLLSIAIIAALPFSAMAENISGAMYTAPTAADTNHPAPTTNADAPYGRIDIDTADQDHIATTAYVKGAYNSAIAGINAVNKEKQDSLFNIDSGDYMASGVFGTVDFMAYLIEGDEYLSGQGYEGELQTVTATAVSDAIHSQRVKIYTTWDDDRDSATTQVALETFVPED